MFKKLLGAGLAAVSTVVAACEGAPTTQQVYRRHDDVLSTLQEANMVGPVLLQVHGNPFASDQDALDAVLVEELEGAITRLRGLKFTTNPDEAGNPKYRVIVAMGAMANQSGEYLCTGEEEIVTETADPIRVVAVLCVKDTLYSEVSGSIKAMESPDEKSFRKWVGQVGRDLLMGFVPLLGVISLSVS